MFSLKAALCAGFLVAFAVPVAANPGGGSNSSSDTSAPTAAAVPSLSSAQADIDAKRWQAAIAKLKLYIGAHSSSADAYNLIGYAYRNLGDYKSAAKFYAKALQLDPKHTGALEYQGILFIKLGQADKAKANLAKIEAICGNTTCENYVDLAKAIGG